MKTLSFGLILVLGIIFFGQPIASAQNITEESYEKAKRVLDESVAAYGGIESLRSIRNFSIRSEGDFVFRNQSIKVGGSDRAPLIYDYTSDIENDRYLQIYRVKYPGAIGADWRRIFDGKELFNEDMLRKNTTKLPAPPAGRNRDLWLPHFSLLNACERAQSLRYLGTSNFNNRPHEVVSFVNGTGQQISLYIDNETKLLSKLESMISDEIAGDTTTETIFPGYKTAGNFKVPTGRIIKVNDEITREVRYTDVAINKTLTDDEFKLNPEFKMAAPISADFSEVKKLAENVYTVSVFTYEHLRVLFINFKDYIWVMEAPGVGAHSRQVIAKIRETIPGKPIKYLAVSHYHWDHAGGARTYVAEGATLVTTKENREFFERFMKSKFTIAPDDLALKPQPLKIEFVENGKRVFTDGVQTVELYNIGPSPHAEDMLVAYLPNEKILFEADLLDRPENGDYPIAEEGAAYLAEWMQRKKLAVEKIIPVHGTDMTMDELLTAVEKSKKARK